MGGLGVKCSKEVATAIRGAIILAKLSIIPVRRGYWGNRIGKPHTVPCKVTGTRLLLHGHDLQNLVLKRRTQEEVYDLKLLNRKREEINLFQLLDLHLFNKTTELGHRHPFLISFLAT